VYSTFIAFPRLALLLTIFVVALLAVYGAVNFDRPDTVVLSLSEPAR